jgi:histidyl-tRNA synthetase
MYDINEILREIKVCPGKRDAQVHKMIITGSNLNCDNVNSNNIHEFALLVNSIPLDLIEKILLDEIHIKLNNVSCIDDIFKRLGNIKLLDPRVKKEVSKIETENNNEIMNLYSILVKNIVERLNGYSIALYDPLKTIDMKLHKMGFYPDGATQAYTYVLDILKRLNNAECVINWYYKPILLNIYNSLNKASIDNVSLNYSSHYEILSKEIKKVLEEAGISTNVYVKKP